MNIDYSSHSFLRVNWKNWIVFFLMKRYNHCNFSDLGNVFFFPNQIQTMDEHLIVPIYVNISGVISSSTADLPSLILAITISV